MEPQGAAGAGGEAHSFDALADELAGLFGRGVDSFLEDDAFDEVALRVFRWQLRSNPVYRRFAEGRGATEDSVRRWQDIPAVPTRAFKHLPLVSGPPGDVERIFRTSGTTGGGDRRGEHRVLSVDLYRAALLPNLAAHLFPEGRRLPLVSLIPSPERVPDSSLSEMVGTAMDAFGGDGSGWFVDPDDGIDGERLWDALEGARSRSTAVVIATTAFALVHWLGALERDGRRVELPQGSRVMETGGFKGRSREVPREELYAAVEDRLGIPRRRIVNEYGMTELLSQFWEPVLREDGGAEDDLEARRHVPPPWVRTRVLDPVTLAPRPTGAEGILCHLDLANAGSVCHVLTEDRGVAVDGGFRVLGRRPGAEPRGCSLAMDELLGRRPA